MYGAYPIGDGITIFRKLFSGDNPRKICFINVNTNSINAAGEFADPWGMPYKINFLSTNNFVIASAGKDKIFGNKDDIIFNSASNDFVRP